MDSVRFARPSEAKVLAAGNMRQANQLSNHPDRTHRWKARQEHEAHRPNAGRKEEVGVAEVKAPMKEILSELLGESSRCLARHAEADLDQGTAGTRGREAENGKERRDRH